MGSTRTRTDCQSLYARAGVCASERGTRRWARHAKVRRRCELGLKWRVETYWTQRHGKTVSESPPKRFGRGQQGCVVPELPGRLTSQEGDARTLPSPGARWKLGRERVGTGGRGGASSPGIDLTTVEWSALTRFEASIAQTRAAITQIAHGKRACGSYRHIVRMSPSPAAGNE